MISYETRLSKFAQYFNKFTPAWGLESWYGRVESRQTIHRDCFKECGGVEFGFDECIPVMLRGSKHCLQQKYERQYHYPCAILDRYVRRKKITALTDDEWELKINQAGVDWYDFAVDHGCVNRARSYFFDYLHFGFVGGIGDGKWAVLVDGKRLIIDEAQREALLLLNSVRISLNDIESGEKRKRKRCKTKSGQWVILENSF